MTNYEKIKAMYPKTLAIKLFGLQGDIILAYIDNDYKLPFSIENIYEWLLKDVDKNMLPEICSCGYCFENDETICPNCGKKVEKDD